MSTTPKSHQLEAATGLSPLARQWIKALVSEAAEATARSILDNPAPAPSAPATCSCQGRVDDLALRVEYLERRHETDERYSLTKAKVIELLKKHGIE